MSHSQFHCTGRAYLDMHGLIFETSICYWQDQPGRRGRPRGRRTRRPGAREGGRDGPRTEEGAGGANAIVPARSREARDQAGWGGAEEGRRERGGRGSAGNESHAHTARAPSPPPPPPPTPHPTPASLHNRVRVEGTTPDPFCAGQPGGGRRPRARKTQWGAARGRGDTHTPRGGAPAFGRRAGGGPGCPTRGTVTPCGRSARAPARSRSGCRPRPDPGPRRRAQAQEGRGAGDRHRPDPQRRPEGDGSRPADPPTRNEGPGPGPEVPARAPPSNRGAGGRQAGGRPYLHTTAGRERPPGRARAHARAERDPQRGGRTRRRPRTSTPKTPRGGAPAGPGSEARTRGARTRSGRAGSGGDETPGKPEATVEGAGKAASGEGVGGGPPRGSGEKPRAQTTAAAVDTQRGLTASGPFGHTGAVPRGTRSGRLAFGDPRTPLGGPRLPNTATAVAASAP